MVTRSRKDWLVTLDVWVALEALEARHVPFTLKALKKELANGRGNRHLTDERLACCLAEIASWQTRTNVVNKIVEK